ncbi:MAG: hypothetical protein H6868_08815 [Rhodospirillales bacterium]|nr:hypothetical protein [Rhodospirillales bacterium]
MPYLLVQTNAHEGLVKKEIFLKDATSAVAEMTGKPAEKVMIGLQTDIAMSFGGSEETCAFVHLKSLGLPPADAPRYVAALCDLLEQSLHIHPNRVFVQLSDHPRNLWGSDSVTFG